jgi:hypothetical protein
MTPLSDYFRSQAEWRRSKAEEYPEDKRNEQSAAALEDLAEFIEPDEQRQFEAGSILDALEPHLFQFSLGGEETARAVVRYGFGYPVNAQTHTEFLEELAVHCTVDAYEFARGEQDGADPTGTLLPCEIDAAKADVTLPPYYFERRGGSTEPELEKAVAEYSLLNRES